MNADIHDSVTIAIEKLGHARFVLDEQRRYLQEFVPNLADRACEADGEYISAVQAIHAALFELENIEHLSRARQEPARPDPPRLTLVK